MTRNFLPILIAASVLTACAAAAQRQAQTMVAGDRIAIAEAKACVSAVQHDAEFAPIIGKLPTLDAPQPTMAMLTDETVPTERETRLITARHDRVLPCRQHLFDGLMQAEPAVAGAFLSA